MTCASSASGSGRETRWAGPLYRDYGTPGVARVGQTGVVALPDGRVLRARDGGTLLTGLGDLWFVGPHAAKNTAAQAVTVSAKNFIIVAKPLRKPTSDKIAGA